MIAAPPLDPGSRIVRSADDLQRMVTEIQAAPTRAFDFETSGLRYFDGQRPIGVAMGYWSTHGPRAWYTPVAHQTAEPMVDGQAARRAFADALTGADELVGHNLKFDLNMARADDWTVPQWTPLHDSMIQAYLIREARAFKLERVVEDEGCSPYADPAIMADSVDTFLKQRAKLHKLPLKRSKKGWNHTYLGLFGHAEVPVDLEGVYACRDIGHTLALDRAQRHRAMGCGTWYEPQRQSLYANEMLLVRALADMEYAGQRVDVHYLERLAAYLDQELEVRGRELETLFRCRIDWNNDNKLRSLLYDRLRFPVYNRTPRGLPSVDRGTLMSLRQHHPGMEALAEWRARFKVRSAYTLSLANIAGRDGRIHTSFNQWGTATGRLSSSDPNLQNVPSRHKELARLVRLAFPVDEGRARVYADYSQIELRVLAWATGSRVLTEAYQSAAYDSWLRGEIDYEGYRRARAGEPSVDVHGLVCSRLFGIEKGHVEWDRKRKATKIVNFGVPYGGGHALLSGSPELRLPEVEAKAFHAQYHEQNPEIAYTRDRLLAQMLEDPDLSFVNWAGRVRHGPRLDWRDDDARSEEERSMFASMIQGGAGELTRFSIVRLYLLQQQGLMPGRSTSTVHDEVQVDCDVPDIREAALATQREMENYQGAFGSIPVVADLETSVTTWADKKDWSEAA
tara:strand:+ start:555 stop:2594 length:2040 start_codon:yes stop_codon:yes gene_type:complete